MTDRREALCVLISLFMKTSHLKTAVVIVNSSMCPRVEHRGEQWKSIAVERRLFWFMKHLP